MCLFPVWYWMHILNLNAGVLWRLWRYTMSHCWVVVVEGVGDLATLEEGGASSWIRRRGSVVSLAADR